MTIYMSSNFFVTFFFNILFTSSFFLTKIEMHSNFVSWLFWLLFHYHSFTNKLLLGLYPNFEFYNSNGDASVDAFGDASIQSSFWSLIIFLMKDLAFIGYCQCDSAVCVCLYLSMLNIYMQRYTHWCIHMGITYSDRWQMAVDSMTVALGLSK